jgi:hypothetical protein
MNRFRRGIWAPAAPASTRVRRGSMARDEAGQTMLMVRQAGAALANGGKAMIPPIDVASAVDDFHGL